MRILLAACALLVSSSLALAQPKSPERILSAECIAYFRYDGYEPHKKAYDQTALAMAMKEGLGDFFDHVFAQLMTLTGGEFPVPKLKDNKAGPGFDVHGVLRRISKDGFLIGIEAAPPGRGFDRDDLVHVSIIFPNGAGPNQRAPLDGLMRWIASTAEMPIVEEKKSGRLVRFISKNDTQLAWWAEGEHLVCSLGLRAFERTLRVIEGRQRNLTSADWYRDFAGFKTYETDLRGYINLARIVDHAAIYGLEEPGLESIKRRFERQVLLSHLGVTGLKDVTFHLGFDGKFQRSTVRLGVVEPERRSGLLRLVTGPIGYGLDKLPPLPPDADYVSVRHVDWGAIEDYIRASCGLLAVSSLLDGELPPRFPNLDRIVGGDFRKDFIDQLDTTVICYGGHSEGPFFLGQGFAVKVKDAKKVQKGLDAIIKELSRHMKEIRTEKRLYRGQTLHVFAQAPLPVTYAIHDGWLVFGLMPQPVQGFILRSDKRYKSWQIPAEAKEALLKESLARRASEGPKSKLLAVSVSDPRPVMQLGLSVLPIIAHSSGMFDADKIPHAQSVNEWLFPNTGIFYDDGNALRWENHYSINEPDDLLFAPMLLQYGALIPFSFPMPRYKLPELRGGADADPLVRVNRPMPATATAIEKDGVVHITATVFRPVTETRVKKVAKTVNRRVFENGKTRVVTETAYQEVPYSVIVNVPEHRTFIVDGSKDVQVLRKDGKPVDVKDLPKLLEKKTNVLLVTGGKVDEAALPGLAEGTLIIRVTQVLNQTTPAPPVTRAK